MGSISAFLHCCPQLNSKTNDLKVFKVKWYGDMTLGYPTSGMVFGVERSRLELVLVLTPV